MTPTATLLGAENFARALLTLPDRMVEKAMRPAITAGCRVVLAAAKRRAPKDTGRLKKSMGVRVKKMRRTNEIVAFVGVRTGFSYTRGTKSTNPGKHGRLVESGRKRGKAPMSPRPWLEPAYAESRAAAIATINATFRAKLPSI